MIRTVIRTLLPVCAFLAASLLAEAGTFSVTEDVLTDTLSFQFHFRLDSSVADTTYLTNSAELSQLYKAVNGSPGVKWITIKTQSSPEGPYAHNIDLSNRRAQSIQELLESRLPEIKDRIVSVPAGESWESLRELVSADTSLTIERRIRVLEVIDSGMSVAQKKRAMRRLPEYGYLKRLYYPVIRNSRIVLSLIKDSDSLATRHALPQPQTADIEVLTLAETELLNPPPIEIAQTPILFEYTVRQRFVALKTNLLYAAVLCANLGVEAQLWNHGSLDVPVWYSPYDITSRLRLRLLAVQPELRYWLRQPGNGFYAGVHGHVVGFNVSTPGTDRYQDPNRAAWGLGIGAGYVINWGKEKHWGLEFSLGAGFIDYKYDAYKNCPNGKFINAGKGIYWGVTRAAINLTYRWYYHRTPKTVVIL